MSGSVTIQGLGSGMDMAEIVDSLVEAEQYQLNRMQTWKSEWESKISAIQGLNTKLTTYESTVNELNTASGFLATTASTSDDDVAEATSSSTAMAGTYEVEVGAIWSYRKAVTLTNDSDSDLATHLVHIDENQLDSNFWSNVQADYADLRFYHGDTQLDFHVQNWDYGAQTADIWVQVDNIDANGDEISMYYGNASATDASTASLVDLKNSWVEGTGIKGGLWHLDNALSDESGNGNTGAVGGAPVFDSEDASWVEDDASTPEFGQSLSLDGAADYVEVSALFTVDSTNNRIDFKEDSGSELTAEIATGTYTATELETAVKSALEAQGAGTYTVTYDAATQGFTIAVAGGVSDLDLLWNSGGNAETNAGEVLGFSDADVTGGTSHTSDTESVNNLDMTSGFTASAWIKLDPADRKVASLVDRFNDSDDSRKVFSLGLNAGGQAFFEMHDDTLAQSTVSDGADLADNAWHCVAVTVDNTDKEIKLYVDGSQVGSTTSFSGAIQESGDALGIGARIADGSASNLFKGLIDEVKVAGRVYSAAEIEADYDHMATEFDSEGADCEVSVGDQVALGGLATAETEIHTGVAASTTVVNDSGSEKVFSYRYAGGDAVTVTVPDSTTLAQLVNLINTDSNNPGVTARILNDGLATDTSYHLVLTGNDTGKANYILIDESTTLDGTGDTTDFTPSTFAESQTATNAQLKINDYGIERSSNVITDAAEGVTFNLNSEGTATVTVNWDTNSIKGNIEDLVSQHNTVIDYIKQYASYDSDSETAGLMFGNYGFLIVKQRLNDILSSAVPGLADGIDTYTHLAQIGIETDPDDDGAWVIDDDTLTSALANDLEAVKRLFIEDTCRTVGGPTKGYDDWTGSATIGSSGTYTGESDSTITFTVAGTGTYTLGADAITINWSSTDATAPAGSFTVEPSDAGVPQDIGEVTGIGKGVYITLSGLGDTVVGGDAFEVKAFVNGVPGIAERLSEELEDLTDTEDGPMNVLIDNYEGICDNIDVKIEREERRIALVEQRLIDQYNRLEATLTSLSGDESTLESLLDQLPSIGDSD